MFLQLVENGQRNNGNNGSSWSYAGGSVAEVASAASDVGKPAVEFIAFSNTSSRDSFGTGAML